MRRYSRVARFHSRVTEKAFSAGDATGRLNEPAPVLENVGTIAPLDLKGVLGYGDGALKMPTLEGLVVSEPTAIRYWRFHPQLKRGECSAEGYLAKPNEWKGVMAPIGFAADVVMNEYDRVHTFLPRIAVDYWPIQFTKTLAIGARYYAADIKMEYSSAVKLPATMAADMSVGPFSYFDVHYLNIAIDIEIIRDIAEQEIDTPVPLIEGPLYEFHAPVGTLVEIRGSVESNSLLGIQTGIHEPPGILVAGRYHVIDVIFQENAGTLVGGRFHGLALDFEEPLGVLWSGHMHQPLIVLEEPPGGVCGGHLHCTEIALEEPPGETERLMVQIEGIIVLPDRRVELPGLYRPTIKTRHPQFSDNAHFIGRGVTFALSARLDLERERWPSVGDFRNNEDRLRLPAVISTPRGPGFDFNGVAQQWVRLNPTTTRTILKNWSFFLYFYSRPPLICQGIDSRLFDRSRRLLLNWDHNGFFEARTLYIRDDITGNVLSYILDFNLSADPDSARRYYMISGSLVHGTGLKMYEEGVYKASIPVTVLDPGLSEIMIGGALDKYGWGWTGTLMAYYEWGRALTDAEHATVAMRPFCFMTPE